MNKIIKTALVVVFSFVLLGVGKASAMSESDLLKKITATYDINGYQFHLSEGDKALAKRYFDQNKVSAKDCDYISAKIDEALKIVRNAGVKDFSDFSKLPANVKSELKALVTDIASNTNVKATTKKGALVIYNEDGSVFAEITKLVKDTGSNMYVIPALALIIVASGAVVITRKLRKTNA